MTTLTPKEQKKMRRGAVIGFTMIGVLGALFVLDMINKGMIYRSLTGLHSENDSMLPGDTRVIGTERVKLTFLS